MFWSLFSPPFPFFLYNTAFFFFLQKNARYTFLMDLTFFFKGK